MKQPNGEVKYSFSPSLLDSFAYLLNSEESYDKYWGKSEDPSMSLEEYELSLEQSLLDSINRVPFSSEAAAKGTCFNDLVDTLVHQKVCGKTAMRQIKNESGICEAVRCELTEMLNNVKIDYSFDFDIALAREAADYFKGCLKQVLVNAYIDTKYGIVNLYGFIDELRENVVYDIKTTKSYSFGDFEHKWQRHVYPYCLIESGMCTDVKEFEYTIFKLVGGNTKQKYITADVSREVYSYNHEQSTKQIREHCEHFIQFIDAHREQITNDLIFREHEHNH